MEHRSWFAFVVWGIQALSLFSLYHKSKQAGKQDLSSEEGAHLAYDLESHKQGYLHQTRTIADIINALINASSTGEMYYYWPAFE